MENNSPLQQHPKICNFIHNGKGDSREAENHNKCI